MHIVHITSKIIRLSSSWFLAVLSSATRQSRKLCSSARPGPYYC